MRKYRYGNDIRTFIRSITVTTLNIPDPPPAGADDTDRRIWEKEVDKYVKQRGFFRENMKSVSALILGQCTDLIRSKLSRNEKFDKIDEDSRPLDLLSFIKKAISFNWQSKKFPALAMLDAEDG